MAIHLPRRLLIPATLLALCADAVAGPATVSASAASLRPASDTASLDGTSWLFVEIDGRATELTGDIFRDDRYAVDFGAEVLVGYGGCNRFAARYARSGDRITFTLVGSTRRACSEPAMSLEQRLFGILNQPATVSFADRDTMVLTNSAGSVLLRRTDDGDY